MLAGVGLTTAASADPRVHVVAAGESLEQLARRYGTSVDALRALNGIQGDHIQTGQSLSIDPPDGMHYTTVPGDRLACIAERFGVPLERAQEDNPGLGSGRLPPGRSVLLRGAQAEGRATVADGETAPQLAQRLGVSLDALARANPDLGFDALSAGDELRVPPARIAMHEVRRGETLGRIARRHRVRLEQLVAWNPRVEQRLLAGARLEIRRQAASESVGTPTCGGIVAGMRARPHRGYVLRNPARSWATERTIARLESAFEALLRAHPRASRVRVHDLSLPGGGPIDDHRSHHSGRDVDITYHQRRCDPTDGCPLQVLAPDQLDVTRQWALLRHWLRRGEAEAIFIDYALQAPLYREAQRRGASAEELARWFQYPRRGRPEGVIRHFPNHRDHLHVRFACHESERRCR